jgi:hypothetical protein
MSNSTQKFEYTSHEIAARTAQEAVENLDLLGCLGWQVVHYQKSQYHGKAFVILMREKKEEIANHRQIMNS